MHSPLNISLVDVSFVLKVSFFYWFIWNSCHPTTIKHETYERGWVFWHEQFGVFASRVFMPGQATLLFDFDFSVF